MADDESQEIVLPDPEDDAAWAEHEQSLQGDWDERTEPGIGHFQNCECAQCQRKNVTS